MKSAPLELRSPTTQDEALAQLARLGSDARVLAGGQSLLPLLRYRVLAPHVLLDINRIPALRELSLDGPVRLGALVRHADLERAASRQHATLAALLAAHAREIAFWPVRTRGTAVGSVLQADPKGDWPLMFFALDARIELASSRGTRTLPVRTFVEGPLQTQRAVDELATALLLTDTQAAVTRWGRSKLVHRAGEYAMSAALALERGGRWECWLGAAGERPFALPGLAGAIAAGDPTAPGQRARWVALTTDELAGLLPEASPAQRHRHAVTAVDAACHALRHHEECLHA